MLSIELNISSKLPRGQS